MVLGNPAERLHKILVAFESASGRNVSVTDCWCTALGCSTAELPACLQSALSLIPEMRVRVESQGLVGQRALLDRYEALWLKPFMPDRAWATGSHGLIDTDSLLALSSMSAIFAALEPKTAIVDAEQSQALLGLLDEARTAVREAVDLPPELRTVIMDRLHDVQWSIDHYGIHGAEGLQAALDRLGAEMARTSQQSGSWRKKVGTALLFGWLIFSNFDDFATNIGAGSTIIHEISDWASDAQGLMAPEHLELPPVRTNPSDEDELADVVDAELVEDEHESG